MSRCFSLYMLTAVMALPLALAVVADRDSPFGPYRAAAWVKQSQTGGELWARSAAPAQRRRVCNVLPTPILDPVTGIFAYRKDTVCWFE